MPSVDASSTTRIRSTNSGIPASVVPISCSSSWAGTTTATRFPSTIGLSGGAVAAREERIREERRRAAEQEADQPADERRVAAAARRRLDGGCGLDDLRLLDVLRERELLLDVRLQVEQLAATRLVVVERAQEDELVERADALLVHRLLERADPRHERVQLLLDRLELPVERVDLRVDVLRRRAEDHFLRERVRRLLGLQRLAPRSR